MTVYIILIYILSIIGFYGLSYWANKSIYKGSFKELALYIVFSPVVSLVLLCMMINMKIICRNRPRPLSGELKTTLIGCVLDEDNNIIPLKKFNLRHNSSFTMEDVYGKKFMQSLSDEDRQRLKESEEEEVELEEDFEEEYNTIEYEDGLDDDIYTEFCKDFVEARDNDWWDLFETYLAEDVILISYNSKRLDGKAAFIEYWRDLWERGEKDNVYYKSVVKKCVYNGHSAVLDCPKGYKDMYLFFRIENDEITHAVYTPQRLQKSALIRYYDLDHDMSSCIDIHKSFVSKEIEAKPLRLPCLSCGALSENLLWYFYNDVRFADLSYAGETSICACCGRVVEFCPSTMSRTVTTN